MFLQEQSSCEFDLSPAVKDIGPTAQIPAEALKEKLAAVGGEASPALNHSTSSTLDLNRNPQPETQNRGAPLILHSDRAGYHPVPLNPVPQPSEPADTVKFCPKSQQKGWMPRLDPCALVPPKLSKPPPPYVTCSPHFQCEVVG